MTLEILAGERETTLEDIRTNIERVAMCAAPLRKPRLEQQPLVSVEPLPSAIAPTAAASPPTTTLLPPRPRKKEHEKLIRRAKSLLSTGVDPADTAVNQKPNPITTKLPHVALHQPQQKSKPRPMPSPPPPIVVRQEPQTPTPFKALPEHLRRFLNAELQTPRAMPLPWIGGASGQLPLPPLYNTASSAATRFLSRLGTATCSIATTPSATLARAAAAFVTLHQQRSQVACAPKPRVQCCTWLGLWLPPIVAPDYDALQLLFPHVTTTDEVGRTTVVYDSERSLRKLFQARHEIQVVLAQLHFEQCAAQVLLPLLRHPQLHDREALSLLRTTHSVLCCNGAESTLQLTQQ